MLQGIRQIAQGPARGRNRIKILFSLSLKYKAQMLCLSYLFKNNFYELPLFY